LLPGPSGTEKMLPLFVLLRKPVCSADTQAAQEALQSIGKPFAPRRCCPFYVIEERHLCADTQAAQETLQSTGKSSGTKKMLLLFFPLRKSICARTQAVRIPGREENDTSGDIAVHHRVLCH
jgi:hypothetical protein